MFWNVLGEAEDQSEKEILLAVLPDHRYAVYSNQFTESEFEEVIEFKHSILLDLAIARSRWTGSSLGVSFGTALGWRMLNYYLSIHSEGDYTVDQEDHLNNLVDAFTGSRVAFTWEFDDSPSFHARSITTDTGWKISIDRGLDIFQKFETGPFSLQQAMQEARLARGAEVTYIRESDQAH